MQFVLHWQPQSLSSPRNSQSRSAVQVAATFAEQSMCNENLYLFPAFGAWLFIITIIMSQSVQQLGHGLDGRGLVVRFLGGARIILCSPQFPDLLWTQPTSNRRVEFSFSADKAAGRVAKQSSTVNAKIKWSYTTIFLYAFTAWRGTALPLLYPIVQSCL